jgi:excisionase family DNA binding protein
MSMPSQIPYIDPFREDPLMTTAEVADYCRVSESTVKKWRRKGLLPSVNVIADARFRRSDVNLFIETCTNNEAMEKERVA